MGHFRVRAGMRSKTRQGETRKVKHVDTDGLETYREIPLANIPAVLMLPIFSGEQHGAAYKIKLWTKVFSCANNFSEPRHRHFSRRDSSSVATHASSPKLASGMRLLTAFGIDAIKPLVRGFILGEEDDRFGEWVTTREPPDNELPSPHIHEVSLMPVTSRETKAEYIVAEVRLFAMFGAPRNYVKVGQRH